VKTSALSPEDCALIAASGICTETGISVEAVLKALKKPEQKESEKKPAVKESEKKEETVEKKCEKANCDRKCGLWHKFDNAEKRAKKKAKKAAAAKAKADLANAAVKPESMVNGCPSRPGLVLGSVGWASTNSSAMNFTVTRGGILVCKHIFGSKDDSIMFKYGGTGGSVKRAEGKEVAHDLLFFRMPSFFLTKEGKPILTSLKIGKCSVGDKVCITAYEDEKSMACRSPVVDQGHIASLSLIAGAERGFASYSSNDGYCGAPILNVHGHVVGIHFATTSSQTVFVPLVDAVADLMVFSTN
jgi:hypothetical protein